MQRTRHQNWLRDIGEQLGGGPMSGAAFVARRLNVSARHVRIRAQKQSWPASWFAVLKRIGTEANLPVQIGDFAMLSDAEGDDDSDAERLAS